MSIVGLSFLQGNRGNGSAVVDFTVGCAIFMGRSVWFLEAFPPLSGPTNKLNVSLVIYRYQKCSPH